jgi:hypothetical protein
MSLIITDIPTLSAQTPASLARLTPKDRVIVLSPKDATIPVSLFAALSSLKAKLEFEDLPENAQNDPFALGFTCGLFAGQAKPGEEVRIQTAESGNIQELNRKLNKSAKKKNPPAAAQPDPAAKPAQTPAPAAKPAQDPAPAERQNAAAKPSQTGNSAAPEKQNAQTPAKAEASAPAKREEQPAQKRRSHHEPPKSVALPLVKKAFADQNYTQYLQEQIAVGIEQATDKDVSLPFMIKLNSGVDMKGELLTRAEKIFDQIHK